MRRSSLVLALVASTALAGAASAQTPQTKIGVAAAVNQQLTGTPPSAASRVLQIGNDVFHRERLVTDARGQAQMLFVDGSAFTVGPDSDLQLDEFVYDPASGTGKLAATAAKGVIRFVGGKLSKNQPVTITTPTATIGIRGGIGIVSVDAASGATRATFLFGHEMTVTSATGAVERIARPGFTTSVQSSTTAPTAATKATGDQIKQNLDQLNGRPGAAGGAPQQPTDNQVAVRMPAQGPVGPPPVGGPKPPGPQQQGPLGPPPPNRDATQQSQQNAVNNAGLPAGSVVAYRLDPDPALGSSLPTVRNQATGASSPFYAVSSGPTGTVKSVQVSVAIDGQGTGQRSVVVVTTGEGGDGAGMLASTRGTSRTNADRITTGVASSSVLNGTGAITSFAAGRVPDGFVQNGSGTDSQLGGGSTPYGYRQNGTRVTSPPALGARETLMLNGYASAFADSSRSDGKIEPSTPLLAGQNGAPGGPGNVSISTDASTGRLAATFQMTSEGGQNGATGVTFNFGADPARGTYVDRTRFAAVESSTAVTITDSTRSISADSTQLYMVSSGLASALPNGVQACQCEFAQWGWWGGVVTAQSRDGATQTNHLHMGNWVAGPVVSTADMPTTGSASYAGHAVGTVVNNTARYTAAGNFSAQFDFASRKGNMTIGNFDGMTMSGAIASQNGRDYGANLDVTGRSGLAGRAQGSFFSGAGDPVRETGGQFTVAGTPGSQSSYGVNGIFVGKKQ